MNALLISVCAILLSQCTGTQSSHQPAGNDSTTVYSAEPADTAHKKTAEDTLHPDTAAYKTIFNAADSILAESLIAKFAKKCNDGNGTLIIDIARELRGIPYVAKTLENDHEENLVVNLRQLDCTTYVENVLAIYLCIKNGRHTFDDYCHYLRSIRYAGGTVSYASRQHYFTEWIEENTKDGFVGEIQAPNPPFTAIQHLNINFMSTHTSFYPMLKNNTEMTKTIAETEKRLSGKTYRYIPKSAIANTRLMRSTIHNGDIIAITTSKSGLDTSHIGIAVWHNDGLHMLNASQIHKKVVEEPMTLYKYMQKHPSQTGIRIVRIN